jgi:endonuclease-3
MNTHINDIFETFANLNPEPNTELEFTNNFTLLIAVVLSAQMTDKGVNIATKELFAKYDSPEKIIELGQDGLKEHIKRINYYNTKAKNIIALSHILVEKYNSSVPDDMDALTSLPGVGRKTANVVMNCAFGAHAMPVDTHVFRVAKRLGIAYGDNPEKVENELLTNIPKNWLNHAHHWLVLHGRYICKARKPLCEICPVNKWCEYYNNNLPSPN